MNLIKAHCDICGERLIKTEDAYNLHVKRFHAMAPRVLAGIEKAMGRKIVPLRTTTRTKAEIVHDMEKLWGAAIIPEVKPWHALDSTKTKRTVTA